METNRSTEKQEGIWPKTLWTVVTEATGPGTAVAEVALRRLCVMYHPPIVKWLLRCGYGQDAQDLANGFVEFLLEKSRFANFTRGQPLFRSFLIKCLKGFLRDEWRKRTAEKRGGTVPHVDIAEQDPGAQPDLERDLDSEFARTIHGQVLERLEQKFRRSGKLDRFQALKPLILGRDFTTSYEKIGQPLGLKANAVKKAVFDLRDDYCIVFRNEVAQTVSLEGIDDEMRYLLSLLSGVDLANRD